MSETPQVDRVAGDAWTEITAQPSTADREIFIRAEFVGGDPTQVRVRDVSITFPVLNVGENLAAYEQIIRSSLTELRCLADLPARPNPEPFPGENTNVHT